METTTITKQTTFPVRKSAVQILRERGVVIPVFYHKTEAGDVIAVTIPDADPEPRPESQAEGK